MSKVLINSAAIRKKDLVVSDGDLNVVENSLITVIDYRTGRLPILYSVLDPETPIANPFTADDSGQFAFFVEPALYKIKAVTQTDDFELQGEVLIDATSLEVRNTIELYGGGSEKSGAENAAALELGCELSSGKPLIIGDSGSKYVFDKAVVNSVTANIVVDDDVLIETSKNSYGVLWRFESSAVSIKGNFTMDCLNHNAVGIQVYNEGNRGFDNIFEDFTVTNCRQFTAEYSGQANGVTVWGGFESSTFNRVKAINISSDGPATRANGAIARGLVIRYNSASLLVSKNNYFNGCHVENLSPASEADGIFVQENPFFYGQDTYLDVRACTFIDCLKRSVKSQNSHSYVSGNLTIRRKPSDITDDTGSFGVDYDMQYSNATCIGNQCIYYDSDYVPRSAFGLSAHQTLEYNGEVSVADQPTMAGNFSNNIVKMIGDGTPKVDFTGRGFRFITLQNRINPAGGRIDFTSVNVTGNECDVPCQMFVWCFLLDGLAFEKQIQSLNINNNYARDLSQCILLTSDAGGSAFDGTQITANISNFTTFTQTIKKAHTQDTGSDRNTINYTPKKDDYFLGAENGYVTGESLNDEQVDLFIIVPKNQQFKAVCEYSRRSNSTNQVKSYVELIAHPSTLGGVLGVARNNEIFDRQAGQWQFDTNLPNWDEDSDFTLLRLKKEPGVTTDSYGSSQGRYVVRIESASPVLITKQLLPSGSGSTQYNMNYFEEDNANNDFVALVGATHAINSSAVTDSQTPTNPKDGDKYAIWDYRNFFDQFPHTITASGTDTIAGGATYTLTTEGLYQEFVYQGVIGNWQPVKAQQTAVVSPSLVYAVNNSGATALRDSNVNGADLTPSQQGTWKNASGNDLTPGAGGMWSKQ